MKTKDYRGITLIALIITIIVLLILAGVSISMVVGDNGILSQAVNATTATDVADTKEQIEVALVGYLDSNGDYTISDVKRAVSDTGATLSETTVTTAKGNEFDISDIVDGAIVSWSYDDDGNVTNGSVTLAIGDYVDYAPGDYTYTSSSSVNGYGDQVFNTSSYVYGWRVLGADEDTGELLIISEDLIGPDSGGYEVYKSTYGRTYFDLYGQAGYANCEDELNAICSIYGNGTGATGARSINVDDINKITGYNPNNVGVYDPDQTGTGTAYGSGYVYEYGNEVTYTKSSSDNYIYYQGTKYPTSSTKSSYSVFTFLNGDIWTSLSSGESVTLTSTHYYYYPNTLTTSSSGTTVGISTTSTEYYMLFTNSSTGAYSSGANSTTGFDYWLASSDTSCQKGYVEYRCEFITSGTVNSRKIYDSNGSGSDWTGGVRPVASLSSDISLSEVSDGVWTIN